MPTSHKPRHADTKPNSVGRLRDRWSQLRHIVISGFILIVLAIAVVWSVPDSPMRRAAQPVLTPVAAATGLEQSWRMFSPNPPRRNSEVLVVVAVNGEKRTWTFEPDRNVLRSFHWDRWRKVKEQLMNSKKIRRDFATWVAQQLTKPGERVDRVSIVLFTESLPAPGADGPVKKNVELLYDRKYVRTEK